ncbi:MAG TPA: serine/threonine-protein kinase, partial [Holophaga sp.]|nr:serine/threonine-protein kinase [Holophaga sp.]
MLGPPLGKGGMGEVVEAWDMVLCRTVALKFLRNMEPTAVIRFMHEAQIQARVVHPNICRIYDVEASEGTVKIAMQLVRGPSLEAAAGTLGTAELAELMAQVAEAVHAAHQLNLIHRDLKPSNILLEQDAAGRWTPFICDFGLAISLDEPALTATNGVIGTPAYMAPEQYNGERRRIGPPTDVFGLGGTLYFALVGQPPGSNLMPGASLSPKALPSRVPPALGRILQRCLEPRPEDRYPTAEALAKDLRRFLLGDAVEAPARGPWSRRWRRSRRLARVVLGGLAGAAALAGALALANLIQGRRLDARMAGLREIALDMASQEQSIRMERMLPAHDLGPARARARTALARMRERMAGLGPKDRGFGHWALARVLLVLGEAGPAREEADRAWAAGFRVPDVAYLQACALGLASLQGAGGEEAARRLDDFVKRAEGQDPGLDALCTGLTAYLRRDFPAALEAFRLAVAFRPWDANAASLALRCQGALAEQQAGSGDLEGALARFQEARALARKSEALFPSDPGVRHQHLDLALGEAFLLRDRGALDAPALDALATLGERALDLDREDPALLEAWLQVRFLEILQADGGHRDARRPLDGALLFLGTRLKEPLPPGLREARMCILWMEAQRVAQRGEDPGPVLAEAFKDLGPPPPTGWDWGAEMLVFRGRVEAARGRDPRSALAEALDRLKPRLAFRSDWQAQETAGKAWLAQAEWEAPHGADPGASLAQALRCLDAALLVNPRSPSLRALGERARSLAPRQARG